MEELLGLVDSDFEGVKDEDSTENDLNQAVSSTLHHRGSTPTTERITTTPMADVGGMSSKTFEGDKKLAETSLNSSTSTKIGSSLSPTQVRHCIGCGERR